MLQHFRQAHWALGKADMAIDPTAPVSPTYTALPVGGAPAEAAAALLARARAATAETATVLGALASADGKGVDGAGLKASPSQGVDVAAGTTPNAETIRTVVRQAAARAVAHQTGLAPLLSDLSEMASRPDTPPAVREAARALIRSAMPTDKPVTSTRLREAVRRSGAFLETDLARMGATEAARTAGRSSPALPQPDLGRDLKAGLLVFRTVVSTWLGEVQEPAGPEHDGGGDRPPARSASGQAPATAPSSPPLGGTVAYGMRVGAPAPSFESLPGQGQSAPAHAPEAQALRASEASFSPASTLISAQVAASATEADAPPGGATPAGSEPDPDLPADALHEPAADGAPERPLATASPAGRTVPAVPGEKLLTGTLAQPEAGEASLPEELQLPDADHLSSRQVAERSAAGGASPGRAPPPPPFPGGPMSPQAAHLASLRPDASAPDLARHLLRETSGAIDRQTLMQIASMAEPTPGHPGEPVRSSETVPARVMLDLPLQTPQGIAVAQFEISRDGGGGGGSGGPSGERTWRARFSLDVEPLGPVHVQIALTGAQTRVSLWAERPEAMARLRGGEETLNAALRQAELTPELAFHAGAPLILAGGAGRFVDRAS